MPGVIGAKQDWLWAYVNSVHDSLRGESKVALFVNKNLTEMSLTQTVAGLVQRHRFDVNVCNAVVSPDSGCAGSVNWIVVNLAEGGICSTVIVDVGKVAPPVDKPEGEGCAKREPTEIDITPASMLHISKDKGTAT